MNTSHIRIAAQAAALIGGDSEAILQRIVQFPFGDWYLRKKIIKIRDRRERLDNTRPLKYALYFDGHRGRVEFVKEGMARTPDLKVEVLGSTFFLEVKKLRFEGCENEPALRFYKTVAEKNKKSQLPRDEVGLVAIDNFRIGLEQGVGYRTIEDAFSLLDERVAANPSQWLQPSAVIVSAGTYDGAGAPDRGGAPDSPWPYFIWLNRYAERAVSDQLLNWLLSTLPSSSLSTRTKGAEQQ